MQKAFILNYALLISVKGQTTSFNYDALGRTTQRAAPGQTDSWTYEVLSGPATGCSATLSCGRLVQASNGLGYSRAESYDSLARPSQSAITIDGITYNVGTSYDSSGRVASVAYPIGTDVTGTNRFTVGYSYNSTGYLSSLTNANSSTTLWTQNTADAYLNSLQETAGNGVVTTKSYDAMERLATIQTGSSGGVQNFAYHWDSDGNLSNRVDSLQSYTEAFTYDPLGRLTGASQSGGAGASATFNYDYIGNITTKSDIGTYTYPAAGAAQPHAVQTITGSVNNGAGAVAGEVTNPTYLYDANGNMIKGAGRTITYNAANLPAQIDNGVNIDSFTYDSEHRRYKEAVQNWTYISMPGSGLGFPIPASTNGRQVYIQTGQGIIAYATITAPGAISWTSYFGTSEIKGVYKVSGGTGTYSYYHHDHLGSITAITTAAGAVLERTSFDAWGKLRSVSGAADPTNSLTSNSLFTYTGQENLSKVALLHYNARTYDPQIGRFNGADPLTTDTYSTQGWNRYAYVGNNPLNSTDPTGQIIVCVSNVSVVSSYNNDEITLTESTSTSCSDDGTGNPFLGGGAVIGAGNGQGGVAPGTSPTTPVEIVVTGKPKPPPPPPTDQIPFVANLPSIYPFGLLGPQSDQQQQDDPCAGASDSDGSSDAQAAPPPPPPPASPPRLAIASWLAQPTIMDLVPFLYVAASLRCLCHSPSLSLEPLRFLGPADIPTHLARSPSPRGLDVNMGVRVLGTTSAMRLAGRAVPYVGEALLAYDAVAIGRRTAACMARGHK